VALAIEKAPGVNEEARGVNRPEHHAVFLDLEAFGGVDVPFYFPRDAENPSMDVPVHLALVVDHDRALGADLPFEVGVDADEAGSDFHLSLNLHARVEPSDPVAGEISQLTSLGLS
jgi:hypothetical protein